MRSENDERENGQRMRALTFTLGQRNEPHIAYRMFGTDSEFERERVYHLNVLEDGTVVLFGKLRGDLERARTLLEEDADVLGYSISGQGSRSGLVFVHARPPPEIKRFLELPRTHGVFFDFPIKGAEHGGLRVTMIGETNGALQKALADVPAELDVTVERIGAYPEVGGNVVSLLTDRQREVLDVALDLGYYDVPRKATHRDIADQMGLSVGTVGEHLQKIEARVLKGIVS
ncbi:HTH DNA binding domain-containing protein [Halogranum amylolyticum]|uniref:HTH DNA binding domain-containing protein n=2 Tax=Halogranum amylolyticum TaxID=660520 RepID=A0A1H8SNW1_9EURY|nr:HTH DNA binding domain-containing protein [Halogranum amylolyticum]